MLKGTALERRQEKRIRELISQRDEILKVLKDTLWGLEAYHQMKNPEWDSGATEESIIGTARTVINKAEGREP